MKILFIAKLMPWDTGAWGGDEHTYELADHVVKQGHEAIFVNSTFNTEYILSWKAHKLPYVTHRSRPFYPKRKDLCKLINETKPDIVHHFSTMGFQFERKLRKGKIPSICSLWTDRIKVSDLKSKWEFLWKMKLYRFWAAHCEQYAASHADRITTTSMANARSLAMSYGFQSVIAIPRGLDTEEFSPRFKPRKIILVPCRLDHEKGVHTIIRVFGDLSSDYPDWILKIAGVGPAEESLKSLAKPYKRIKFLGKVESYDMPALYSHSSVVVLNSFYEPFGAVVLEAGACARPVIATKFGGPSEIIQHGKTGILINPEIPEALRVSLEFFMQDESNIRLMGEHARKHICKNYSWKIEAKAYATLYEEVIDEFYEELVNK